MTFQWLIPLGEFYRSLLHTAPRGGYSWEFLAGVCRPVLQILTLSQTKKCYFRHPFSGQTSKIHTRFQKLCYHYLD